MSSSQRVLLIGWGGADWAILKPLIAAGHMPNLQRLMSQGVAGELASIHPEVVQKRIQRKPTTRRSRFKLSGTARVCFVSCGFPVVVTQQPVQELVSPDDPDLLARWRGFGRRVPRARSMSLSL